MWLLHNFNVRKLVEKDAPVSALFFLTFLIGLTVSLQLPLLSLFMTKAVGANPLLSGFFLCSILPQALFVHYS